MSAPVLPKRHATVVQVVRVEPRLIRKHYVLRPRGEPEQAPGPNTESGGGNGEENEPRVRRQARPFREETPDMCQREQAKDRAGGYDIGFHRNRLAVRARASGRGCPPDE